jgi:hypothetical protein
MSLVHRVLHARASEPIGKDTLFTTIKKCIHKPEQSKPKKDMPIDDLSINNADANDAKVWN